MMSQDQPRTIWDKIWKDKDGNIVIWQTPNVWLWIWIALMLVSIFLNKGKILDVINWAGSASLGMWAVLELLRGASYFRRILGLIVLVFTISNIVGR